MSPQLLGYPDFDSSEPFIDDTEYSHDGIGTVLSQIQNGVERPIAFNARRLKPSESQYALHKGELLVLIFAINTYRFFLTGRQFLVRTNNSALSWLKTQKDLKGILMRWLRILSTYEFDSNTELVLSMGTPTLYPAAPMFPSYLSERLQES